MKQPKFLVDTMLGRLATWLRILGFDAKFLEVSQRKRMLEASFLERRVLITREAKLAKAHAYKLLILREQHWWDQLAHVWKELGLGSVRETQVFSRCTECNKPLSKVPKAKCDPKKIPPKALENQKDFYRCPKCRKIFWPGSHLEITLRRLREMDIPLKN